MTIYFFNNVVLVSYPKYKSLIHGFPIQKNNFKPVFPKMYPKGKTF